MPIPGTSYCLYLPSNADGTLVEPLITDDVMQFLRTTPGWVIDVRERQLTVFDDRTFSSRCRVPGNVPAFLEDVAWLHSVFVRGLNGSDSDVGFSIDRALEHSAAVDDSAVFRGTRLRAAHSMRSREQTAAITSFGCLWTVMTVVFFSLALATDGMRQEPVVLVLGPVFLLTGLAMLIPGVLGWLSRWSLPMSEPKVLVAGEQPSAGKRLSVSVQQRNISGDVMPNVSTRLTLGERSVHGATDETRSDPGSSDWQRGCEVAQTFDVGDVPAGETVRLQHVFRIPRGLRRKAKNSQWWGIDVTTTSDDRTIWSATYVLPQPELMKMTLVVPGVVFGVVWGFFTPGVLGSVVLDALDVRMTGPVFGIVALAIFGGAIGGGVLGYQVARRAALLPVIQPIAESVGRTNLALQLFGSGILAMGSFFFSFYLADDVFNVFGWQTASPPEVTRSLPDEPLEAEKGDPAA